MGNRLVIIICLAFVTISLYGGCQQKQAKEVDILAREPNLATINIPSDYAAWAIESAGGFDAWAGTIVLPYNCVVAFYQSDSSFYLTKQQYVIYPWSNSIEMSGREPHGDFSWQLLQGRFEVLRENRQIANMLSPVDSRCFAESIFNIVTAPVRLSDKSVSFTRDANPVKIQGQWYLPIERHGSTDIESLLRNPQIVYYQNRDNFAIDILRIVCPGREQFLTVRGYDYKKIKNGQIVIPHRIEVFLTDSQGNSQKRLVKIDYN